MKRFARGALTLAFWLAVWTALALLVHRELLLPAPWVVVRRLCELAATGAFWRITAVSIGRVLLGVLGAVVLGVALAVACTASKTADALLCPLMTVVKSTPVASFVVLALNTRGVLYVVTDGTESITSFADLRGKNVYVPVQNPTFIFQYLCEKNGLTVGTDITIDNTYAQPAELNTALASGEVHIAVLPEPMVTIARAANPDLTAALDLTAEWDKVAPAGSLVQGCVVVRKAFADAHPNEVKAFLGEYQASIEYLTAEPEQAGQMIQDAGIFAKAAVAAKAIPNCNVCFVSGADMQAALTEFLTALSTVAPQSIGGKVPGDDFYCILK